MIHPAQYIEHTNLKPDLTHKDVEKLIEEAKENQFKGICIPPFWVKKVRRDLGSNSDISLVTVVGFPLGYNMTETKMKETEMAISDGANEIDLVWNISAFKSEMIWPKIEIVKIASICHEANVLLKVIVETSFLSEAEIIKACKICTDAGADFVKSSTGFSSSGAVVSDIKLMRENLPSQVGIKASAGIKSYEDLKLMINAGAERIGTSSGLKIIQEYNSML
jgi:deoxyribose-phosphate aldolase